MPTIVNRDERLMRRILPFENTLPTIDERAFIAPGATVIGDVVIGADSSIWYGCVVRGDVNEIRIGEGTNIQDLTMIHCAELGQGSYLGDHITVGHAAVLHACSIEDHALIGIQACVMDDAIVEQYAMVAAGALITPGKRVKSGEVWAGRPAKKIRDIREQDRNFFAINNRRYIKLAQRHTQSQAITRSEK